MSSVASQEQTLDRAGRVAAIYARVSSERQRQDQTIASQTVGLRELAAQRGLLIPEDLAFEDEGSSGATLQRPALGRAPATARRRERSSFCSATHPTGSRARYAYQVLLLEEFARVGVEVCFAKEPERGVTPEDELLRQFQGMIAEYERAQIRERSRRGKAHRARSGSQAVMSGAPYGYRYVRKSQHMDAFYGPASASEARWQIASTLPVESVTPNRSRASSTIPRRETRCRAVNVTIAACNLAPNGDASISSGNRALVLARQSRQRN